MNFAVCLRSERRRRGVVPDSRCRDYSADVGVNWGQIWRASREILEEKEVSNDQT